MSKIPTPLRVLESPKSAFEFVLKSIIVANPAFREAKIKPHLLTFIAHPIIKELLGQNDDPPLAQTGNSDNMEIQKLQETLVQLSEAVEALKKDNAPTSSKPGSNTKQKAGTSSKPTHRTYSAAAGSRPLNPSLVVDLAHLGNSSGIRIKPEIICRTLNEGLSKITPPQVQLAAVRWTAKGNLVVTGGPSSTPQTLQTAAPHISAILILTLKLPSTLPISQPRANVKWSKILINGVPTGTSKEREPYSPDECHAALAAINPTYAPLTITQKPNWVRPPTTYQPGAISSLSVAFEDPDGTKMKTLLEDKYLYLFGNRVVVKKWKQQHCTSKGTTHKSAETSHHPTNTAITATPSAPVKSNALLEETRNTMPIPDPNSPLSTPKPATRANPPRRAKGN